MKEEEETGRKEGEGREHAGAVGVVGGPLPVGLASSVLVPFPE